uniref:Uncharacterized protein n=1 Tax=Anguilla anguilla TaxID=7936 RepID=A0A0E9V350_ANGAN
MGGGAMSAVCSDPTPVTAHPGEDIYFIEPCGVICPLHLTHP